jgi:P4 family phage/plasmid primase-like protien
LLEVFFDDQEMVDFFQRLIGYVLLGKPDEDILVIPYGNGANGKSTVLGAIREVLGAHARMSGADTFLAAQGATNAGGAREDVLRLRGARFVYVTEPDEGSELKEGMVKSMTGGEPMPARGLYAKHTIEVVPTWTTFMPTNHRPVIKGDDNAIWRRLLPLPFTRNFETDQEVTKDPDRGSRLREEWSGILRWCVIGAARYLERGLAPPATVRGARDAYRADMDLLADWLAECCEEGPALEATTAELWASWEAFARGRGELLFLRSSRALGRRLANRFKAGKVGGQRGFRGLRVVQGAL